MPRGGGGLRLAGPVVHVAFLIGFRSKLLVMVNWAWQWFFQARGARLITGSPEVEVKKARDLSRHSEA